MEWNGMTDRENVLYIPTKKGYTILISTISRESILKELGRNH